MVWGSPRGISGVKTQAMVPLHRDKRGEGQGLWGSLGASPY